ncbi:MAG: tetratricopeptide repeat protein [Candidatus Omnitrophica bacterium]|nr:tetratricopeptide repeat protein [Candidatus Omnitrophota bacterium]
MMITFGESNAGAGEQETRFQHEHRTARIRYLTMRKQEYQNIVDTNIFQLAVLYLEDREYGKALEVLQRTSKHSPDEKSRWTALYAIGDIEWVENGNTVNAIQAFEKVQGALKPLCDSTLIRLYEELGMNSESAQASLAALDRFDHQIRRKKSRYEREHGLVDVARAKANIYSSQKKWDEALQCYRSIQSLIEDKKLLAQIDQAIKTISREK